MDAKIRYLEGACFFCQGKTHKTWCDDCGHDFISDNTRCPICARNSTSAKPCGSCLKSPPFFTSTEVLFNYQYPGDYLIKAFKFNSRPELANCFAEKLTHKLKDAELLPEVLIPVPLHKYRQRERGYNQSLEFASSIGSLLGIPVNTSLCHRIINTERQSSLPMKTRKNNVKGAFKLNHTKPFDYAVIVDDVITTGSTVNEIARLLKKSGCRRVDVWAIARTQF
ncbi:MAG: ComF family protein [Gammaproteobacteria bacterium]|jgi:ComF family protein